MSSTSPPSTVTTKRPALVKEHAAEKQVAAGKDRISKKLSSSESSEKPSSNADSNEESGQSHKREEDRSSENFRRGSEVAEDEFADFD